MSTCYILCASDITTPSLHVAVRSLQQNIDVLQRKVKDSLRENTKYRRVYATQFEFCHPIASRVYKSQPEVLLYNKTLRLPNVISAGENGFLVP
jgi:hypothetical protein